MINVEKLYTRPLNTPQENDKCTTGFKRTSLSSSSAIRPPPTKAEARLGYALVGGRRPDYPNF